MPEETKTPKKEKGFFAHLFTWVAWGFCILAVYVLSIGPVAKFVYRRGPVRDPFVENFYAPLGWFCEHEAGSERFLKWYLGTVWDIEVFRH
jgi:hypothetical protein